MYAIVPRADVEQRELAADDVRPGRTGRVLEVGEPHLRTRVEGVDGHLRVGRPGDLDAPVLEARAGARDPPRRVLPDAPRLGQELRVAPVRGVDAFAQALGEQLVPAGGEALVQLPQELDRLGGQYLVEAILDRSRDLDHGLLLLTIGQNCSDSVLPTRASVALSGLSAVAIRSK